MKRSLLLALGLIALGWVTLGIPGAFILEVTLGLLEPVLGISSDKVPPDAAWPIALYLSFLWPLGLPLAHLLSKPWRGKRGRGWRYALVVLLWCVGLALLFYKLAVP